MNIAQAVLMKYKISYQEYMDNLSLVCKKLPPLTMKEVFTLTDEELLDKVHKYFLSKFETTLWSDDFADLYGPCELEYDCVSYAKFTNREKQMLMDRDEFQYRY